MKKLKLFIFITMLATLCTTTVFASQMETDGDIDALLSKLEIKTVYQSPNAVSREEFVILLGKALRFDPGNMTEEDPFDDVKNYDLAAAYLAPMKELGIVTGDGDRMFFPNRKITMDEAAVMLVRALNYTKVTDRDTMPQLRNLAKTIGIFDGIDSEKETVSDNDAKRAVYNFLNADLVDVVGVDGENVKYYTGGGVTILQRMFGIRRIEGPVTGTVVSMLTDGESAVDTGKVSIGAREYTTEDIYDNELLGKNVYAFIDDKNAVISMFAYDNREVEITVGPDISVDYGNFMLEYGEEGKKKKKRLDSGFKFIYNGKTTDFSKELLIPGEGSIVLIDNNGDDIYDVVKTNEYQYMLLDKIDSTSSYIIFDMQEKIVDPANPDASFQKKKSVRLDLKSSRYRYDAYLKSDAGYERCSIQSFIPGTVLRYYVSADERYFQIYGNTTVKDGVLTGIYDLSAERNPEIMIDGERYATNNYFKTQYAESMTAGQEYTFYFDDFGKVAAAVGKNSVMAYGYVINAQKKREYFQDEVHVKILSARGDLVTATLADKILLDGVPRKSDAEEVKNVFFPASGYPHQVLRYLLNQDGEIVKLDTVASNNLVIPFEKTANLDDSLYKNVEKESLKCKGGLLAPRTLYSDSTAIFYIPPQAGAMEIDDASVVAGNNNLLKHDDTYLADVYDIDDSGVAGAIVIYKDYSNPGVDGNSDCAVIDSVMDAIDEEGNSVKMLQYWKEGNFYTATIESEKSDLANDLVCGDVIRYVTNTKGEIVDLKTEFSYERGIDTDVRSETAYAYGLYTQIYQYKPGASFFVNDDNVKIFGNEGSVKIVLYDRKQKSLRTVKADEIKDVMHYGRDEGHKVYARLRYSYVRMILVID